MSILHFIALVLYWFVDWLVDHTRDLAIFLTGACTAWIVASCAQRDAIGGLLAVATMMLVWLWAAWGRSL